MTYSDLLEICTFRKYLILIVSEEVTEITPPPKEKVELIELDDQVDDVSQLARRFAISRHDHVHTITYTRAPKFVGQIGPNRGICALTQRQNPTLSFVKAF